MIQLMLAGPPGAGKTSIAQELCLRLGLDHVATGDLLRSHMTSRSKLGQIARQCIKQSKLVPDNVVVDMVADKVRQCTASGYVLDAFPRTPEQVRVLEARSIVPTTVVILNLSEAECVARITGRRFDRTTDAIYHLPQHMPDDQIIQSRLYRRNDDRADRLPPRFTAYRSYGKQTITMFKSVAHVVNASGSIEEVVGRVLEIVDPRREFSATNQASFQNPAGPSTESRIKASSTHAKARPFPYTIREEPEDDMDSQTEDWPNQSTGLDKEKSGDKDVYPATSTTSPHKATRKTDQSNLKDAETHSNTFARVHDNNTPVDMRREPSVPQEEQKISDSENHYLESKPEKELITAPTDADAAYAIFKEMLLDGFEVTKHGRRGRPHSRMIFTDLEFKRIFWQKPSRDHRTKKARMDQSMVLPAMVQVLRGMKTEVLKRSGNIAKYDRYLSLIGDDRTLDMEFPTEERCEEMLVGFERLLLDLQSRQQHY